MVSLIGRRSEQSRLDAVFEVTPSRGRAIVVIEGDAGMGKSSLLAYARDEARRRGWLVIEGGITAAESILGWAGLATLLQHVPPSLLDRLPSAQRSTLLAATGSGEADAAATDPMTVAASLASVLRVAAADTPVLVTIDDLHWLDRSSAGALAFAIRSTVDVPLTFVLAARPQPLPVDLARLGDTPEHIAVDGLSIAGIRQLLLERVGLPLGRTDLIRIHTATLGNPMHVLETGRQLTVGRTLTEALLPPSLHAVVAAMLSQLPEEALPTLRLAALMTRPRLDQLRRLLPAAVVDAALAAGEAHDVIALRDDAVEIRHPVVQAGLIDQLGVIERRQLERRIVDVVDDPEQRAVHLAASAEGVDESIAAELEASAAAAAHRGDVHVAAERAQRALELTPADPVDAWRRRKAAVAHALIAAGDATRALPHFVELRGHGAFGDDVRAEAAIRAGLALCQARLHDIPVAVQQYTALADDLHEHLDLQVMTLLRLMRAQQFDDLRSADRTAEHALRVAEEHGDPALVAIAEVVRQMSALLRGQPIDHDRIRPWMDREAWAAIGREQPDAIGELFVWTDMHDEAEACQRHLLQVAEETGRLFDTVNALDQLADVLTRRGRWEEAETLLHRYCALVFAAGEMALFDTRSHELALLEMSRGRAVEARRRVASIDPDQTPLSTLERAQLLARRGSMMLIDGHPAEAAEALRSARALMVAIGMEDLGALPFWSDLVEALVAVGEVDEARDVAVEMAGLAARSQRPRPRFEAARAAALVAAAVGDPVEGELAIIHGLAAHEEIDVPFERARLLLVGGSLARRAGRRSEARVRLEMARELFARLGAVPFVARVDAELERLGGRATPGNGGREPTELTPTERQIGRLVAAGQTNAEVAAELFISARTVEANLTRLYRKLGVRSRTELAARATDLG